MSLSSSCLDKRPFCVYDGSYSSQIVKSPPHLADIGPLGSCLDIRIVGFVFIGHGHTRRGSNGSNRRSAQNGRKSWRASPLSLKISQRKTSTKQPCSTTPYAMLRTSYEDKRWLYGQLIVYIFDGNRRLSARNRP